MLHICALQYFSQYTIKATLHCMPLITAIQKANDCQTNLLQQTLQHNCTSARGFTYSVCHDRQTTHTDTQSQTRWVGGWGGGEHRNARLMCLIICTFAHSCVSQSQWYCTHLYLAVCSIHLHSKTSIEAPITLYNEFTENAIKYGVGNCTTQKCKIYAGYS